MMPATLQQNINDSWKMVSDKVARVALESGRTPDSIRIIAVSKRKPAEVIRAGIQAGIIHFGENKIQEAQEKLPQFSNDAIVRHCIGHVQSNKLKFLPGLFDMIHTLDSLKASRKISTYFGEKHLTADVLIQVNITNDPAKSGLSPEQVADFVGETIELPNINIRGFMTIGPNTSQREEIRKAFKQMKQLSDDIYRQYAQKLSRPELSMGMSNDYDIAIQEGATYVRIGRAIFGERD